MDEFTPITTQDAFDAAISERIKRERESLNKKYSDYNDLKAKAADYAALQDKVSAYDKTVAELQAKIKGYETNSVKMRIAQEKGIPLELATRLAGESEDDIRQDAETLVKFIGGEKTATPPAPLRSTEPANGSAANAALKALSAQLKGD